MSIDHEIIGKVAVLTTETMYNCGEITDTLIMAMDENPDVNTLLFDESQATYRPTTEDILDTIHSSCSHYEQIRRITLIIARSVQGDIGRTVEVFEDAYGESFSIFLDKDEAWLDLENPTGS